MTAVSIWFGLASPIGGAERGRRAAVRPRRALGDRAGRASPRKHGAQPVNGRAHFTPPSTPRTRGRPSTARPIPPARHPHRPRARGHRRRDSSTSRAPRRCVPAAATTGYQSNSWRQRLDTATRAQLLVGRARPGVRARPRAEGPRRRSARSGPGVRVRLCPAARPRRRGARAEAGRPRRPASRPPRRPPQGPPAGRLAAADRRAARGRVGRGERAGAEAEPGADRASGSRDEGGRRRRRHADPDRHQSLRGR